MTEQDMTEQDELSILPEEIRDAFMYLHLPDKKHHDLNNPVRIAVNRIATAYLKLFKEQAELAKLRDRFASAKKETRSDGKRHYRVALMKLEDGE